MRKPLMRIPYTDLLPPSRVIPSSAASFDGALAALHNFFAQPSPARIAGAGSNTPAPTVVLSGAGLSVASGLADYRGVNGTYRVNKTYRPIYYHEFVTNHEARKRYWARSFLGWTTLHKAAPNAGHYAVRDLGRLGLVGTVITQNVDSFHPQAHPDLPTLELHGYLRATVCTTCRHEYPRDAFQNELAKLNPAWADFLAQVIASGALDTEDPDERRSKGMRTNPDGDVDLPGAPYTTFRYPACPRCLANPPPIADAAEGHRKHHTVEVDHDGAWKPTSTGGVLKPAVVMFGESIANNVKTAAETAIDDAGRLLVLGTSLATYSAWRLAKRAMDRGIPIAVVSMGGVRGEDQLFAGLDPDQNGAQGVRVEHSTDRILPALVDRLREEPGVREGAAQTAPRERSNHDVFKDMLS